MNEETTKKNCDRCLWYDKCIEELPATQVLDVKEDSVYEGFTPYSEEDIFYMESTYYLQAVKERTEAYYEMINAYSDGNCDFLIMSNENNY